MSYDTSDDDLKSLERRLALAEEVEHLRTRIAAAEEMAAAGEVLASETVQYMTDNATDDALARWRAALAKWREG